MTGTGPCRGGRQRGAQPGRDRGTAGNRERGTDRYRASDQGDPFDTAGWPAGASLEELPSLPLPVVPRRGPRLGLGGTLAVGATAALLAAGFGILGGRPSASPSPPVGGVAPTVPRASMAPPSPGVAPEVTPYSACADPPTSRPGLQLQVNGVPHPGPVEVLQWHVDPASPEPSPPLAENPERVVVPADVITEIWIAGGACAVGWNIGLVGNPVLDSFSNPELDPAIALQNRFALTLAPFVGRDLNLRADLFFPTLSARAIWPITVEAVDRPIAALQVGPEAWSLVEGCDVSLALGNGYEYPRDPTCLGDMPIEPAAAIEVDAEARLGFRLEDWDLMSAVLTCGRLSGTSFIAQPEPGCFLEASTRFDPSTLAEFPPLPADIEGSWTIQISACALSGGLAATNSLCGSWYATIEVGG